MKIPLSRCAPSPSLAAREGGMRATDDSLATGRPLLAVLAVGQRQFQQQPLVFVMEKHHVA